ncbi:hypothetical protein SPRG_08446 [Saprolegnia parasitica CBS 223.65]|uniref:Uncharacterized protein n=1 Tax=Saprolegnia parasitica (strain CBS 223.65) TaxID=695850 RepID=A0A067CA79_SAPPC|nr:hypothetical protein SPRG_08446 [Saprolegnia parasitica CBS 223.65]KDO26085.1 hypothetical protein SPRG_08446 [Saprolegnia parasitica CBS 223.65]|eukprot:XP_012203081.1 hypothetical protein SPRG_08446 [Saprolegnia parasitica CBS 223.65]
MSRVSPLSMPRPPGGTPVQLNIFSMLLASLVGAYVASAPLHAYLYENLPWALDPPPLIMPNATWAQTEAFWLLFAKDRLPPLYARTLVLHGRVRYSSETFLDGTSYCHDPTTNTDIYRMVLDLSTPIPLDECNAKLLTKLNNGAILSKGLQDTLCNFAASPNASLVASVAACQDNKLGGIQQSVVCAWLTPGDDLTMHRSSSGPNFYTYYNIFLMRPSIGFLYAKLAARVVLVLYILYRLWLDYYRHCRELLRDCALVEGHRCEVFLGDPTSLILLDPFVTFGMSLDVWLSASVIGSSTLAAVQIDDTWQFMLGCLYLARMEWIAYFSLAIASPILKRLHIEGRFTPVDPTLVAMAATLIAGPLTYQQGHSVFFTRLYLWLFNTKAPDPHSIEIGYGIFFFLCTVGLTPIVLETYMVLRHALPSFNDVKHRFLLALQLRCRAKYRRLRHFGGTIYSFYDAYPNFRKFPSLSQRGLDCYIVVYAANDDLPCDCIRVSLYSCVDKTQTSLVVAKDDEDIPFGHLTIEANKTTRAISLLSSSRPTDSAIG